MSKRLIYKSSEMEECMELLWKKYSSYWRNPMFLGVCIGFAATITKLSISILVGNLIDSGVLEKNSKNLMSLILSIFFYGILGSILWLICKILFQKAAYRTGKQIRLDIYDCMNKMSVEDVEKIGWETIGKRMAEDTECIEYFMRHILPQISYIIFSIIGSILIVSKIDTTLGCVYFLVMLLLSGFVLRMSAIPHGRKHENVKAMCGAIVALAFPVFLCLCLMWIDRGDFTIGNAVTFFMYLYPVRKLTTLVEKIQKSKEECHVAYKQIESILEMPTKIEEGTIPFSTHSEINMPQIIFQNVDFLKDGQTILKDFNLAVSAGESIGIVANVIQGDTISYLLPRFYEPTTGNILLDGLNISQYTFHDLRSQIGVVRKEDRMYIGNFYENLIVGNPNAMMDDIEKALYAVGLLSTVEKMQRGLRTPIWKKEEHILEQRMFCVARMLLKEPSVLVLNRLWEDCVVVENEIAEMLERIKEAYPYITILLIDAQMEHLTGCDQIVRLNGINP